MTRTYLADRWMLEDGVLWRAPEGSPPDLRGFRMAEWDGQTLRIVCAHQFPVEVLRALLEPPCDETVVAPGWQEPRKVKGRWRSERVTGPISDHRLQSDCIRTTWRLYRAEQSAHRAPMGTRFGSPSQSKGVCDHATHVDCENCRSTATVPMRRQLPDGWTEDDEIGVVHQRRTWQSVSLRNLEGPNGAGVTLMRDGMVIIEDDEGDVSRAPAAVLLALLDADHAAPDGTVADLAASWAVQPRTPQSDRTAHEDAIDRGRKIHGFWPSAAQAHTAAQPSVVDRRKPWAMLQLDEASYYVVPDGPPCGTPDNAWKQHASALSRAAAPAPSQSMAVCDCYERAKREWDYRRGMGIAPDEPSPTRDYHFPECTEERYANTAPCSLCGIGIDVREGVLCATCIEATRAAPPARPLAFARVEPLVGLAFGSRFERAPGSQPQPPAREDRANPPELYEVIDCRTCDPEASEEDDPFWDAMCQGLPIGGSESREGAVAVCWDHLDALMAAHGRRSDG